MTQRLIVGIERQALRERSVRSYFVMQAGTKGGKLGCSKCQQGERLIFQLNF